MLKHIQSTNFNDLDVMAGQGTIGLEIDAQADDDRVSGVEHGSHGGVVVVAQMSQQSLFVGQVLAMIHTCWKQKMNKNE